jgi:UDP-N-acetylmuramate dehydrogenase
VELAPAFHTQNKKYTMHILENVSLAELTTLRVGGTARFYVSVYTLDDLRSALRVAKKAQLPICVLGGGSNTVFSDTGWNGVVIGIKLRGVEYKENTMGDVRVTVSAGEVWDDFVADTVKQGFWGLENLSYIPGTVGATPVQNVGAYGVSLEDVVEWVEVLDTRDGALRILTPAECAFGYRDSIFKHEEGSSYIVTRVAFRLRTHASPKVEYKDLQEYFSGSAERIHVADVRHALHEIRGRKFPDLARVGTAGSFFKNPTTSKVHLQKISQWFSCEVPHHIIDDESVKIPLAWILEKLNWKGVQRGAFGCWEKQPLVVVHYGGGTSTELHAFVDAIVDDVKKHTALEIEKEVKVF